jgi:hypothetical protein
MKQKLILLLSLLVLPLVSSAQVRLQKKGNTQQLIVDGQPMLVLGGELSNSAVTSVADIDSVFPRVARLGLNTVFTPVYWNLMEPQEGHFDFTLVDETIRQARACNLRLVFLWFGAWKNSMSCYAPLWFKRDSKRFPRAMTEQGKPLEIASAFSSNVLEADNKAFGKLVNHIAEVDGQQHTVIMLQVENEIGMLESARDHSPLAERAWRSAVPKAALKVLGAKGGTWAEVVGNDLYGQEKFQAYYYAQYVEQLCKTAKSKLDIPLYVNAAMNSRGRKPGEYPSAGPLAHLIPIWRCAAPNIDIYAPDIYDVDFKHWVSLYKRPDNPFFTPETRLGDYSGVRAFYCFGAVDAISFSPFAIDQAAPAVAQEVARSYEKINQLSPLILKHQGQQDMWGVLFDSKDREQVIEDGRLVMTCKHYFTLPWDPWATDGSKWREGGALIIRLAPMEYLIAGSGVVVTFQSSTEKEQEQAVKSGEDGFALAGSNRQAQKASRFHGSRVGIGEVNEVSIDEKGEMHYLRQDNGDQDHQGRHARIPIDDYKILHVKLYEY